MTLAPGARIGPYEIVVLAHILSTVRDFAKSAVQNDDVMPVVVRYSGTPG